MNSSDYTSLLSNPEAVNERQTDALETIVTEFPYFQSARALRLKGLYNQNSFQYNYALKVTAAYTTDRSVLFDFITSDSFNAIQRGIYDPKAPEFEPVAAAKTEIIFDEEVPAAARVTDDELAKQSILTSIRESENRPEMAEPEVFATSEVQLDAPENQIDTAYDAQPEVILEDEFNPEEFGPINEEPQFLPEAIAPVEFMTAENIEFVPVETIANYSETEVIASEPELQTVAIGEIADAVTQSEIIAPSVDEAMNIETSATVTEQLTEVVAETPEEKLEIGKPLAFSKDETHSFAEWLQLSVLKPIVRDEISVAEIKAENAVVEVDTLPISEEKTSKDALIDRFIESNPKMPKMNADATPVVITHKEDHSSLMTETLARVYLEQRKYQKAVQAYEILILKYPEKSSFFADRISEIKNLQQNNTL